MYTICTWFWCCSTRRRCFSNGLLSTSSSIGPGSDGPSYLPLGFGCACNIWSSADTISSPGALLDHYWCCWFCFSVGCVSDGCRCGGVVIGWGRRDGGLHLRSLHSRSILWKKIPVCTVELYEKMSKLILNFFFSLHFWSRNLWSITVYIYQSKNTSDS